MYISSKQTWKPSCSLRLANTTTMAATCHMPVIVCSSITQGMKETPSLCPTCHHIVVLHRSHKDTTDHSGYSCAPVSGFSHSCIHMSQVLAITVPLSRILGSYTSVVYQKLMRAGMTSKACANFCHGWHCLGTLAACHISAGALYLLPQKTKKWKSTPA